MGRYSDGHGYCYGCRRYEHGTNDTEHSTETKPKDTHFTSFVTGTLQHIANRRLDEDTCRLFGYQVGEYEGEPCHVYNFRDANGNIVAQKIRRTGKRFTILGDSKAIGLFGDHLWSKGKRITITEGEIDAMSVSQAMGNKWPVVSLPNGASGAVKAIQKRYEWLDGFETIVLMFDQDEPGRKAAQEVAEILPTGKVCIATLPLKDANECLVAGQVDSILKAFWNARPYRPDGIVMARDLRELVEKDDVARGIPYPFEDLTRLTKGIRPGELVTITAGSGVGKTTFVRELAYSLHYIHRQPVGLIMLEESNKETLEGLVGIHLSKNIMVDRAVATQDEIMGGFDALFADRDVALYDHFGSTEVDNIINRIRYMAKACGIRYVFLDHISILISGLESGDERRLIDMAMTKLRTLVQETGIGLFVVSHLKRPSGDRGHEDGARVSLSQLRGSHAIAQLSNIAIGLQKPEDDSTGDMTEIVLLKNRFAGKRGPVGTVTYNHESGRLTDSVF